MPKPLAPVADVGVKARAAIQSKKRKKLDLILEEVGKKGSISNNEVEKLLGVSDATASRYLATLQKEGKLKRLGSTGKAVRYEMNK
ncbi:MAG: DeoR family transcriptional regulator [bacterium]|nr:DeoR family transcriptional regulator [bacterium]